MRGVNATAAFIFVVGLFVAGEAAYRSGFTGDDTGIARSDFNDDGKVDFSDFLLFASSYGRSSGDDGYDTVYDLNSDGTVGFDDFLDFVQYFGKRIGGIDSFEEGADGWTGGERVSRHARHGSYSYHVMPGGSASFQVNSDWSSYRHLKIDMFNPGEVVLVTFNFVDTEWRSVRAWEYSIYGGETTQHIRIDGLQNDWGVDEGIDISQVARMDVNVRSRWPLDSEQEGIYIDNLRLSNTPTEAIPAASEPQLPEVPPGFALPEFPGFEAGYHTWAIDPSGFQILARPGTGRDGIGRALEFRPLDVELIKIWDSPRTFPFSGAYTVRMWAKGPAGSSFRDWSAGQRLPLSPQWREFSYDIQVSTGQPYRFVLDMENLNGQSAFLDDFTVSYKGSTGDLRPVSRAVGGPTVVTWADGIVYINGQPTFLMGFMAGDPDAFRGSPFNYCAPNAVLQPKMDFMDKCAENGLYTSVNLTATMRSLAPEGAALFARKYMNHPALFSYYLCDEPDHASPSAGSEPPILARATQILHRLDPSHPTHALIIPWCSSNIYRYRDIADVMSCDRYVVRGTPDNDELWTVYRSNSAMRHSATDGQVNIFTPLSSSEITREENWAQAYMCVAAGAGGIMWFDYDGAQAKWRDFLELGRELRSIESFLVGVELNDVRFENAVLAQFNSGNSVLENFEQIRGIGRASADSTALIAVNLTPHQASEVRIVAPFMAHASEAEVLFENRVVPIVDGVIIDDFAGLERHVYAVPGVPDGVRPRPVPVVGGSHVRMAPN